MAWEGILVLEFIQYLIRVNEKFSVSCAHSSYAKTIWTISGYLLLQMRSITDTHVYIIAFMHQLLIHLMTGNCYI